MCNGRKRTSWLRPTSDGRMNWMLITSGAAGDKLVIERLKTVRKVSLYQSELLSDGNKVVAVCAVLCAAPPLTRPVFSHLKCEVFRGVSGGSPAMTQPALPVSLWAHIGSEGSRFSIGTLLFSSPTRHSTTSFRWHDYPSL
jgi:hypothetical protein